MLYVKKDTAHSFYFDFIVGDEFVVPETGTVSVTLTKPDGSILAGYNNLAVTPDADTSNVVVPISAGANGKTLEYELRHLEIKFDYDGNTFRHAISYNIVDRINIPVSAQQVRNLVGLSDDEWPDEQIDILKAYYDVKAEPALNGINVETLMDSGDAEVRNLLEAVTIKSALNFLPALELIAVQSQQADNTMFRRFEKVDFATLSNKLNQTYSRALTAVAEANYTNLTYTTTGLGTDAVTGV
jgi:hypothetical protein